MPRYRSTRGVYEADFFAHGPKPLECHLATIAGNLLCCNRVVQRRNHRAATTRSCAAAEILMLTYLPPATCGVVCTSMTLPLNDPGSAEPAICRHMAIGMITDSIL